MDKKIKEKWIKALLSGDYAQGTGALRGLTSDTYCCLGVLCDILGYDPDEVEEEKGEGLLTYSILERVGLTEAEQIKLASMNDGGRVKPESRLEMYKQHSFREIANYIQEKL